MDYGQYGIANVIEINKQKDEAKVKWYGEIKDQPNHYVLLNWFDTIALGTILNAKVRFKKVPHMGLLLLEQKSITDIAHEIND